MEKEKLVFHQMSISDTLNQLGIPIGPGDYVEHKLRLGTPLLVLNKPHKTLTGHIGLKVKLPNGEIIPVLLSNVHRY